MTLARHQYVAVGNYPRFVYISLYQIKPLQSYYKRGHINKSLFSQLFHIYPDVPSNTSVRAIKQNCIYQNCFEYLILNY